jgi:hypothetical protein
MTFAFPIALTLTALALPIVALYIMKVRLRRVSVSTNLFWKQVYEEKPPRALWQNLRDLVSLILQLLFLMLLVFAIADPQFFWQQSNARRVVVVLDHSASMQATDVQPSRLAAAKTSALKIVDGFRYGDQMAILRTGSTPTVVTGMTDHTPTLRRAIDSVAASDTSTALSPALELARALIGPHPSGQIFVLTDGCVTELDLAFSNAANFHTSLKDDNTDNSNSAQSDESSPTVDYQIFATDAANIGITQFQVRRSLNDPIAYEIFARVKNASSAAVTCRLELSLNDIPIDVIPLKLAADEQWTRSIEKASVEGGELKAVITEIAAGTATSGTQMTNAASADFLLADNEAWAMLPGRERQKVFVVSQGNLFLSKVMEANPLAEITVQKDFPAQWPRDATIVLHGKLPATLPDGNVFVIAPESSCDHWTLGETLEDPIITEQDASSPLMTHVRLDNVIIPRARRLIFTSSPHTLAESIAGDLIYGEIKRPNGKCLVLNVDIDSSDLAFRTAFPILAANALNWFSETSGELELSVSTGDFARLNRDFTAQKTYVLTSPSLQSRAVDTSGSDAGHPVVVGPLNEAGVWSLTTDQQASAAGLRGPLTKIAVNLADDRESDLRPQKLLQEAGQSSTIANTWFSRPFWMYLVIAACLLTTLEWYLYQRRLTS